MRAGTSTLASAREAVKEAGRGAARLTSAAGRRVRKLASHWAIAENAGNLKHY